MIRRIVANVVLAGLFGLTALAAAGCAKKHRIQVESNTCWVLSVDGQVTSVEDDCGPGTFRVAGEAHCATVRNVTDSGYVRVRMDEGQWNETTAPYGSAQVCR